MTDEDKSWLMPEESELLELLEVIPMADQLIACRKMLAETAKGLRLGLMSIQNTWEIYPPKTATEISMREERFAQISFKIAEINALLPEGKRV